MTSHTHPSGHTPSQENRCHHGNHGSHGARARWEAVPDTPDYGVAMSAEVRLRPFEQGECATATEQEAEYDDFGPKAGLASPPPCRLDAQGALAIEADGELVGMVSWVWQR